METLQKTLSAEVQSANRAREHQACACSLVCPGTIISKTRKETEMKNAMWGRTAKEADVAMEAEPPGSIESQDVKHIVDAILDYALPFQKWVENAKAQVPGNSKWRSNIVTELRTSKQKSLEAIQEHGHK